MKAIIAIMLLALLTACAQQTQQLVTCPDGTKVSDIGLCPEPVPEPQETQAQPEPAQPKPLPQDVKDLLALVGKVRVVKFTYFDSNNPYAENIYLTNADKTKIVLETKAKFTPTDLYDTIYLEHASEKAQAYCEDKSDELCPLKNSPVSVEYDEFAISTPFDWLSKIESAELTGNSRKIEGRTGKELRFESEGEQGLMLIDSYYGVPLQVSLGGVTYEYRNMVINANKEAELTHQPIPE